MDNSIKNVIILTSLGVLIGVVGIIAYFHQTRWLMIACAVVCLAQLLINVFMGLLQDYTYPFLSVCILVGYYLSGEIVDGICLGLCLYYSIAILYMGILAVVPFRIIMIIVPLVSIIAFFVNEEHLFITTALFCSLNFCIAYFRRKLPRFSMNIYTVAILLGTFLLFHRNTDLYDSVKLIKGILWAGSGYYLLGCLYAFYITFVKKEKWQNYEDNI